MPRFHGETFDYEIDQDRLKNNMQRVFFLMLDGQWHFPAEIQSVGGAKGLTRVRAMRETQFGSLRVEKERVSGGLWRYRLDLETVSEDIVRRYREWDFSKKQESHAAKERRRMRKMIDRLSDEQVLLLSRYARFERWHAVGRSLYQWGARHGGQ